ncbi:protein SFI1 homolog isoform X2 [Parambassis ranga]|nr:protein SFI1 homolog isoform X2 [Parambassis ranga]
MMRAECHHRYYLYNWTLHSWRRFILLQREKKTKVQIAQSFADNKLMHEVWDRWECFTEMRRIKNQMLESALEQNRLSTMHSAWSMWQTRLQQRRDFYILEERALKHKALTLQRRSWHQWKEMHMAACCQKEKACKAALHFTLTLKRRTLHQWISYVCSRQNKTRTQAVAQRACRLLLLRKCWSKWSNALDGKHAKETRLQAADCLAAQCIQRRALEHWKAYVVLCREEADQNQRASQHHHHSLLRAGLQGLSLNVMWNKAHRLNNNMAVQHRQQMMKSKYWKLWQESLEQAEDQSFQPLAEMAVNNYSVSLLSSCFHHWREKLALQRHMQELEHRADICFAERLLPLCFKLWVEFTLQRRLREQRRHRAEVYNRQRQYSWVFYTWWGRSEKHREEMLSERMAILHEERGHMQRAWAQWRLRTELQLKDTEKQEVSHRLYLQKLLHKTMIEWKDNSTEIRDRRNRELQACRQGDLRCLRSAIEKWKKFVQCQREKKSKLDQMQSYHEATLLKQAFVGWKKHHLQMSQIYVHAEELYREQTQSFLRDVVTKWRENAVLLAKVRVSEGRAQEHFQRVLKLKVFLAWSKVTACAVSKRHQQGETLSRARRSIHEVRLLQVFRKWRKQTREARRERKCMEKARRHHNSKLLSNTLKAWNKHRYLHQRNKVMKRQGILLLRLKMYQTYFELWRVKLQHRRREAKQTERALWHWSLTLQAKVLYGWKLWVTEQCRKREQMARAAQVYRDQLLREGVTCILTYAAHMNDLTTSLTLHSQEQRSQRLSRVVKRCAMRWKQRALCKPQREQEVRAPPMKKNVTFCSTAPTLSRFPSSDSAGQEAEDEVLSKLLLTRVPRRQPRRSKDLLESPLKMMSQEGEQNQSGTEAAPKGFDSCGPSQRNNPTAVSYLHPFKPSSHIASAVSPSALRHVSTVDSPQDLLLPPSAFMTTGTQNPMEETSRSGHQLSTLPGIVTSSGEADICHVAADPVSALTSELLSIQLDMKNFQQTRKQLRAWRKLKEVLESWLETSGKDEDMEKNAVCLELKELEERIHRLSTELEEQKPSMLRHTERIQHLQSVLHISGVYFVCGQAEEMGTNKPVFTT